MSDTITKLKRIDCSNGDSMCINNNNNAEKNGGPRTVPPTTTAADTYAPGVSNGYSKSAKEGTNGVSNASSNGNGVHRSQSNDCTPIAEAPSPSKGWTLFRLMRFLLWNAPLLACWSLLLVSFLVKEVWDGPLEKLLQSYKLRDEYTDLGTLSALDHDLTYYHRRCDHRDISTHDANDLLVDPDMNLKERQEIIMTHGAVVMKDILSHSTAQELRSYLETRHHEFHSNDLKLPWDELFWDGDGGSRLSLGLGPEDASIVSRAITEVGYNSQLKKTLEATLGKDPAVVEVSTLSTMFDAEAQGIHTDSDYFGSSVLYTRSFLHSYTMFISLQDTTSRMGATTICPGTHWCADEDLSTLCQCNYMDYDEDEEHPIGYCNTFEASSNGQTGLDVGVLQRGDAMMFNQNIWHRGPRNYDLERQENRAMFILTFVSRRDYEKGDNRQQGWGTYYYMRHSMWGHLFSDLKTAASGGMDLFKRRIWKAYGLIGASKSGNLPWLEHWARQMANDMDFFRDGEIGDFQVMLRELTTTNRLAKWLFLDDAVLKYLFGDEAYDERGEIGWKGYLGLLIESALHQSKRMYSTVAVATILANGVGYALYCVFGWILRRTQRGGKSSLSLFGPPQIIRAISRSFGNILVGHLLVLAIAAATRHYVLYKAPLFERIHTGYVNVKAFPPLPIEEVVDYEYNKDGKPIATNTFYDEVYPVDLLFTKQEREQRDFRMEHPKHPYSDYYEIEFDRLEKDRRTSDYLIAQTNLPDVPQLPILATAFPERNDVLIGSRFDADFLASMNFVLDFHPGTKEWIKLMKEHQRAVSENVDESYLKIVVDTIVSKILDRNDGSSLPLLSNEGGTPRRFLKQDHETGWWTTMTQTEAIAVTRRALLALAHPKSVGVSYEHWKQVLAESRFGRRRHTALAKKWIPQFVDKIQKKLFAEDIHSDGYKMIVSPMTFAETKKGIVTGGRGRALLPSTGRGLLPKSMVTKKTALSLSDVPSLPSTVLPLRVHLRKLMKSVVTLKIGDHILYKGSDDEDLIFQATIVSIDAGEDELEIQPVRNEDVDENYDDVTMFVHINDIQFYRPMRESDTVWALTSDPDDEDESWKVFEVLFLTPFGQIDIIMTPEFVKKFSDDEEERFDDALDFKKMILTENHTPEIRLRQYG